MRNKLVFFLTSEAFLLGFLIYALTTHFFRSKGLEPQSWESVLLSHFNYMLFSYITFFIIIYIRFYLENYKEE